MPQDWGPVVYSGSATTNTFPVDDTAICKPALKASRKDCISEVCTAGTLPVPLNPACCSGHGQSGPVNLGRMRDYHNSFGKVSRWPKRRAQGRRLCGWRQLS